MKRREFITLLGGADERVVESHCCKVLRAEGSYALPKSCKIP